MRYKIDLLKNMDIITLNKPSKIVCHGQRNIHSDFVNLTICLAYRDRVCMCVHMGGCAGVISVNNFFLKKELSAWTCESY